MHRLALPITTLFLAAAPASAAEPQLPDLVADAHADCHHAERWSGEGFADRWRDEVPLAQGIANPDEVEEDLRSVARREKKTALDLYYTAQRKGELQEEQAYKIGRKELDLPWGKLVLEGGWVIPVEPAAVDAKDAEGKDVPPRETIAAAYVGKGHYVWEAPNEAERWMMNFQLDKLGYKQPDLDKLEVDIDGSALLFFNGKWRALLEEGGEAGKVDGKTIKTAKATWNNRADLYQSSAARMQTKDAFEGEERGYLALDLQTKDLGRMPALSFELDPKRTEAVELYAIGRNPLNRDDIDPRPLGRWFSEEQLQKVGPDGKVVRKTERELGYQRMEKDADVLHYDMDMTAYKDVDLQRWGMTIEGTVSVKTLIPRRTYALSLMGSFDGEKVRALYVRDKDGNNMPFLHAGGELLMDLGRVVPAGETLEIAFKTEGLYVDTIKQPPPAVSLTDTSAVDQTVTSIINWRLPIGAAWFPTVAGFTDAFTFDWTLRVPKPMYAATSGTLLSVEDDGTHNVHTIKEQVPVFFPAIVFGRFAMMQNDPDYEAGETKIRLFIHPGFEKEAQSFIDEAEGILGFYEALFGSPYPYQELDLVFMPVGIGYAQAPSGLVQMDGGTYISKTNMVNLYQADDNMLDIRDNFMPHEIAHFWWGHLAGWADSRDQWASETLSEYTAALYLEERHKLRTGDETDLSGYEDRMSRWGAQGRLGHTFKRTGPLWTGNRNAGGRDNRRTSTIYARGPLIMDMLRDNFGREAVMKFLYTLNQVAKENDNQFVTEDFQKVLEAVVPGVKFDDFMDKYVYGNEPLPEDPNRSKAEKMGRAKY